MSLKVGDWVWVPTMDVVGQVVYVFTKQQSMFYPYAVNYTFEDVKCEGHFSPDEIKQITEEQALLWIMKN